MLFVSVPFLINSAKTVSEKVDVRLENVARTLGASPWQAFRRVTFPFGTRSILTGTLMMWARVSANSAPSSFLLIFPMVTSILIYQRFESYGLTQAIPVAAILVVICAIIFIGFRLFLQREKKRIELKNVDVTVADFNLQQINLSVAKGMYVVILGPTGAGKTVLLESIAGLHTIRAGEVLLDGRDVTNIVPEERGVSIVYQDTRFSHISRSGKTLFSA